MSEHDFCLWLQGFAELNTQPPTPEQWQSIREHLQTVFKKVTPPLNKTQLVPGIIPPSYGPGIIC
jgi:hypothetical protein